MSFAQILDEVEVAATESTSAVAVIGATRFGKLHVLVSYNVDPTEFVTVTPLPAFADGEYATNDTRVVDVLDTAEPVAEGGAFISRTVMRLSEEDYTQKLNLVFENPDATAVATISAWIER